MRIVTKKEHLEIYLPITPGDIVSRSAELRELAVPDS